MNNSKKIIEVSTSTIWRVVLILLFLWFLFLVRDVVFLLLFSVIITSAALPIVDRLEKKKVPRVISSLFLYFLFFSIFAALIYFLLPVISKEIKHLGENMPTYIENVDSFSQNLTELASNYSLGDTFQKLIENASNKIDDSFSGIFSNAFNIVGGIFKLVVIVSLSFYMLVKKNGTEGLLKTVIPKKHQSYVIDLVIRIQKKLGRWLIGILSLIIIVATLDYLALSLLDVPFALMLAIIGGLFEVVPYVGPVAALIPAALVALTVSPFTMLMVIAAYILIQQLENHLITPLVMKKAVGLNPVIIILALLVGGQLAGVLGVLLAVPLATAVSVFTKDIFDTKNEAETDEE